MASLRINYRGGVKPFDRIRKRLPVSATVMRDIADRVMRQGAGSVMDQRRRQATQTASGATIPWKRSSDFGDRRAAARTLHRTGASDQQWAGASAGSITRATSKKIEIGVTGYTALYQRPDPWVVKARTLTRGGKLAMQLELGRRYKAWIRRETLLRGLRNVPRPVAISRRMLERTGTTLIRYLPTGKFKAAS